MAQVPDIVKNARLVTEFHAGYTRHVQQSPGNTLTERRKVIEEKWTRERELGQGTFGAVWLERKLNSPGDNEFRAVKAFPKRSDIDMNRELEAIALFSHRKYRSCFVESFGWYENSETIFIAMEFLPYGDLTNYLAVSLPESEVQGIVSQLLEGLNYMHENHFTHRDLKPANILVKCKGPAWWVKIADFGISKRVVDGQTALRTMAGTPAFIAPEVLGLTKVAADKDSEAYTNAVDVWALGAIVVQLLTTEVLFADMRNLALYALGVAGRNKELLVECGVSEQGCDFISQTLSPRPEERASVGTLLTHSWMVSASNATEGVPEVIGEHGQREVALPLILKKNSSGDHQRQIRPAVNTQSVTPKASDEAATDSPRSWIESARNLHKQGFAQHERKEYAAAERTFQNAISIYEKVIGHDQKDTGLSILWLGRAQFDQDKFADSEKSFVDSTKIFTTVLGREHADTAYSIYWTGQARLELKRTSEAEMCFEESLKIRQKLLGPDDKETVRTIYWIGHTRLELTKYAQAEQIFQETRTKWLKLFDPHDPLVRELNGFLADAQWKQEKYREAEESYAKAAAEFEYSDGLETRDTADTFYWLGRSRIQLKKYAEAEKALQKSANIRVKVRGYYDVYTADSYHYLGEAQFEQKNYTLATKSFSEAHSIRKKLKGDYDEETRLEEEWLAKARKGKRFRLLTGGK